MTKGNCPASVVLAPEVLATFGGIQEFIISLAAILGETSRCKVLSLNDTESRRSAELDLTGYGKNKVRYLYSVLQFLSAEKPSTVIVGHLGLVPIALIAKCLGLIRGYSVVIYGIDAWAPLAGLDRLGAKQATQIISISEYTAREFVKYNPVDRSRVRVIPVGRRRRWESQRNASDGAPPCRLLTVGRLAGSERYKGVDTAIQAVRLLRTDGIPVELDIVGDGDDKPRLQRLAVELCVGDSVRFAGRVSDARLEELYEASHIFLLPSKKEGFGIVFLEAMSRGLPCIGGNHGGSPEVIEHGRTGFLVEFGDYDAIAFYVRQMLTNPTLYAELSANAVSASNLRFSYELMRSRWNLLFRESSALAGVECVE